MSIKSFLNKNTKSLFGKTVAISGSTGGLGRALCQYFCTLGANLVLLDRNMEKSHLLADELREKYPEAKIAHIQVDMSEINTVKSAADKLACMEIDYLILNAGAYSIPRHTCDTGYDNVYQINFVSPYYMARKLLPKIRERDGRIVAVGSIAHNYSKIDESDVDFSTRKKASLVYGNAKRYLTYSLLALSRGDVAVAHPGITFTGITAHYPKLIFAIIKHPMKIIFMKPKKAALSILYAMFTECKNDQWIGPRLFDIWGMPVKKRLATASKDERSRIVSIAENIYNKL